MDAVFWLIAVGTVVHGIVAGLSFDVAAVKLPTRRRIGAVAYAEFARGNDLGNGLVVYPAVGIMAVILVFGATAGALFAHQTIAITPLWIACLGTVAHSFCTARAAPVMLSLKKAPNDEMALSQKLDTFARWHLRRAIFQFLTFVSLVWALVEASRGLGGH